jgi:hypothetical protein
MNNLTVPNTDDMVTDDMTMGNMTIDDAIYIDDIIDMDNATTGDFNGTDLDSGPDGLAYLLYVLVGTSMLVALLFAAIRGYNKYRRSNDSNHEAFGHIELELRAYGETDALNKETNLFRDSIQTNQSSYSQGESEGKNNEVNSNSPASVADRRYSSTTEAWNRAKHFFPGLVSEDMVLGPRHRPEERLEQLFNDRIRSLKKEGRFKPENEIEFRIAVGMDEKYVRKRHEAVSNLREAFGLKSKTPTIASILHLIRKIRFKNPFIDDLQRIEQEKGEEGVKIDYGMDGIKIDLPKEWLQYRGYKVERNDVNSLRQTVQHDFETDGDDQLFVHGTSGAKLIEIYQMKRQMLPSWNSSQYNHDFGTGFYCFKDQWSHALSFAIDRCHPKFVDDRFESSNPCLVLFPDCKLEDDDFYNTHGNHDDNLFHLFFREEWNSFLTHLQANPTDEEKMNWMKFAKMAMYFGQVPDHGIGYRGYLHKCESTTKTIRNLYTIPKIDPEEWKQYCILLPRKLGIKRIFVEFDVDWNEWIATDDSEESIDEGKKALENALL